MLYISLYPYSTQKPTVLANNTKFNLSKLLCSTLWILVCVAFQTKSDDMHKLKHYKKFNITALLKCYCTAPKFNYWPRNARIVVIFGMCIESKFVKWMLKVIWLQMKFGEIFWSESKMDALKGGEGYKQKGNSATIFST